MSSEFTFTFLFHIHRREFFHKNSPYAILVAENTERKHASDRTKNKLQTPAYGKADYNSVVYFNVITSSSSFLYFSSPFFRGGGGGGGGGGGSSSSSSSSSSLSVMLLNTLYYTK
jgi:hypothetical protein